MLAFNRQGCCIFFSPPTDTELFPSSKGMKEQQLTRILKDCLFQWTTSLEKNHWACNDPNNRQGLKGGLNQHFPINAHTSVVPNSPNPRLRQCGSAGTDIPGLVSSLSDFMLGDFLAALRMAGDCILSLSLSFPLTPPQQGRKCNVLYLCGLEFDPLAGCWLCSHDVTGRGVWFSTPREVSRQRMKVHRTVRSEFVAFKSSLGTISLCLPLTTDFWANSGHHNWLGQLFAESYRWPCRWHFAENRRERI